MIVYPAIDLAGGECVRLRRGDFDAKTVYSREPLERARAFQREGAKWLHIVDLDGARDGAASQTELILEVAGGVDIDVQVGGGIRERRDIETLLTGGVARVVVGSLAVESPELVREWLDAFGGERLALAFDVRVKRGTPFPATRGWKSDDDTPLWEWLTRYRASGLRHVLVTDIGRDGMLAGPNVDLYRELVARFSDIGVLASGGVAALADLEALADGPVAGAIVGRALYDERFTLSEALAC